MTIRRIFYCLARAPLEIVNALVTDLQPDANVLKAMNQIEAQRRMRMAAQEKAEAEKILVVKVRRREQPLPLLLPPPTTIEAWCRH